MGELQIYKRIRSIIALLALEDAPASKSWIICFRDHRFCKLKAIAPSSRLVNESPEEGAWIPHLKEVFEKEVLGSSR
jgi:hypothetical protein